jgi:hypothetical protein
MLPELHGSPKQVSWAKRIRTERLASWQNADLQTFKEAESVLQEESSAAWWITVRDRGLEEVLKHIGQGSSPRQKSEVKPAAPAAAKFSKSFSNDEVYRFVGDTRSLATGELVVDPLCPF